VVPTFITNFLMVCLPPFLPKISSKSHKSMNLRWVGGRGERERLFGSREREGKLKITFPFYGKGTGIRKLLREGKGNLRLVIPGIPGNPGNHIKSKIKFKIIFMP